MVGVWELFLKKSIRTSSGWPGNCFYMLHEAFNNIFSHVFPTFTHDWISQKCYDIRLMTSLFHHIRCIMNVMTVDVSEQCIEFRKGEKIDSWKCIIQIDSRVCIHSRNSNLCTLFVNCLIYFIILYKMPWMTS